MSRGGASLLKSRASKAALVIYGFSSLVLPPPNHFYPLTEICFARSFRGFFPLFICLDTTFFAVFSLLSLILADAIRSFVFSTRTRWLSNIRSV
ncbi:hypothetical protein B0T24DRAFT_200239 [Lasiosphaeria ovina]|uniref:Uncharacterized protein n=1 Tax=Lasiosphaeria ovina TaxID=92902 RepID=A0AAE0NFY8_9PEZI|nr:hypothetical protein B0T24DRAFT_200239 [Lasiosphaeria ovina]